MRFAPFLMALVPAAWAWGQAKTARPPIDLDAPVDAVTLYRDRALVQRSKTMSLQPGVYAFRLRGLPVTLRPDTIQARVSGPASVLNAEYEEVELEPGALSAVAEIDQRIEGLRTRVHELEDKLQVVNASQRFLDGVISRAADEANRQAGTAGFELDTIRAQLQFITEEQTRLVAERRTLENERGKLEHCLAADVAERQEAAAEVGLSRDVTITVMVTAPAEVTLDLTYLATGASWQPVYNIRAIGGGSSVTIEYDALVSQATGEPWNDVQLTLSTARPSLSAAPPELSPWFVDQGDAGVDGELQPLEPAELALGAGPPLAGPPAREELLEQEPSVSYALPRPVSVRTERDQRQRARIASIDTNASFVHVAVPGLTDAVYVRGDISNNSDLLLLPASASVFIGQHFVGPTRLRTIAAREQFSLYFGVDEAVKATRAELERRTESTGLFGGGLRTTWRYRIEIDNRSGKDIQVELWDRRPVSRHEQIKIELLDLTLPLARDAAYLEEKAPQGLLKWMLLVPSTARRSNPLVVSYGVRVNRPKDLPMAAVPE